MNFTSSILKKVVCVAAISFCSFTQAATELTMYYPVAVGGALTEIVDGIVENFEAENPDIDVTAIYAGNYNDARVKALAALKSGEPAQLSVMFSIDVHELRDLDAITAFDDVISDEEDQVWLDSFYPALMENGKADGKTLGYSFPTLNHCDVLQQGCVSRCRTGSGGSTYNLGRVCRSRQTINQERR